MCCFVCVSVYFVLVAFGIVNLVANVVVFVVVAAVLVVVLVVDVALAAVVTLILAIVEADVDVKDVVAVGEGCVVVVAAFVFVLGSVVLGAVLFCFVVSVALVLDLVDLVGVVVGVVVAVVAVVVVVVVVAWLLLWMLLC